MAQAVEPIAEGPGPDRAAPVGAPRQEGEFEPLAVTAERIQTKLPREKAVYPGRFMLGYLLIVLFFGALLVAFGVAWSQNSEESDIATNWSFFKPSADSEQLRTRQIATFVGGRYQARGGQELVRVLGGPPAVQDAPVSQFMIRDGSAEEQIGADKAIMYILCGTGNECALPLEASSDAHERLIRRQALELALYTMKYNNADPVAVLLPPNADASPGGALLFRRDNLKEQLDRPLADTLPTGNPPQALGIGDLEAATIDYLTLRNKFAYDFLQAQDGTARMVLNPDRPAE